MQDYPELAPASPPVRAAASGGDERSSQPPPFTLPSAAAAQLNSSMMPAKPEVSDEETRRDVEEDLEAGGFDLL